MTYHRVISAASCARLPSFTLIFAFEPGGGLPCEYQCENDIAFQDVITSVSPWAGLLSICLVLLTILVTTFHGSLFSGPGPWGVPIFGYYPFLQKNLHLQLHKLAKKYGPIYKLNVCGQTFVYMENIKAVRESHVTKAEDFPHRNDKTSILNDALKEGLVVVKGDHWKVLRKFLNQSMRDIGVSANRDELRGPIEDAVKSILDTLSNSQDKPVDLSELFCEQSTRAVVRLFLGDDITKEEIQQLTDSYFDLFLPFIDSNLMLYGTFARYFVVPWISGYKRGVKGAKNMNSVLQGIIDRHRKSFNPDHEPGSVIEAYLKEKYLREKKGDPTAKYFTDQSLVSTLIQAYGDGSSGVGFFVSAYIYEVCKRRDVQDLVYEEIVNVLGTERIPTAEDRTKMPFINSVMKELLRTSTLFPLFPGLECVRDTTVQGVHVPKDSIILLNYWAVHNDPEVYEDPEKFDAFRFMPDKPKVENPISFGVGKRSCAGERLVMTELFLFMTSIFQKFILDVEDEGRDMSTSYHSEDSKFFVKVTPRETNTPKT